MCYLNFYASQRPESVQKTSISAVACLFEALGKVSPTNNSDIKRLVTGLVMTQAFMHVKIEAHACLIIHKLIHNMGRKLKCISETVKIKDNNAFSPGLYDQAVRFGP